MTHKNKNFSLDFKKTFIQLNQTIRDALKSLNISGSKLCIVVDKKYLFKGVLNDGDIRRALLIGKTLDTKIKYIYNKKPFVLRENFNKKKSLKKLKLKKIDQAPIINKKKVLGVFNIDKSIFQNLNVPVVIMSGGYGLRLKPFTNILPKPLIPLNNKPVIDHIIDKFVVSGIKNFYISINKNSHQIMKSYFYQKKNKYKIKFIEEKIPLGTAGSIKYLKKNKKDFFVTNCDVIFDINFNKLYDFHKKNKYDFTLVVSYEENLLSYGVCRLKKNGLLKTIEEKPTFSYLANCGLYLMSPKIFKAMPKKINHSLDMNELISLALKKKFRIGTFIVSRNSWHDVGQWKEYNNTLKRF